jgi:hypothetical protein
VKPRLRHAWLNTLGAVLVRAGRHKEALARLQQGVKEAGGAGTVDDGLLRALVHHPPGPDFQHQAPNRGGASLAGVG